MRTVGLVVARAGSTRVPGKALLEIEGQPVLGHVIRIAQQISGLSSLVLATTSDPRDDALERLGGTYGIPVFRGDPEKVLNRIRDAAAAHGADVIVYVGGDCPLLDPVVVSDAIAAFHREPCDYLSNYDPPTFPGGLDVNVITFDAVDRAYRYAIAPSQRVHAFSYLTFHPEEFRIRNIEYRTDLSTFHWSLDYPEDIEFLRLVYARLFKPGKTIRIEDVLRLIERDAEVRARHDRLIKPPVSHAFLSSPGMMKDINADLQFLAQLAQEAITRADYTDATRCYGEIRRIAHKLSS